MEDNFLNGLLGIRWRKKTPAEMVEQEQDRIVTRRVRKQLEEEQELLELRGFLQRQPSQDKARPANFDQYIGQKDVKDMILIYLQATKLKKTPFPHSIFWSEPGLGKTTISFLIARALQANLIVTSGGQLETKEELLNIFKQFRGNDILFIDEIHAIPRKIAEMLYSTMEGERRFDYTTKANQVVNLYLPPFTLLGATTDLAKLLIPIRQRFQNRFHLVPYSAPELCGMLRNFLARIKYYPTEDAALIEIARRSRNVARYAMSYVKNLIDYCLAEHKILDANTACEFFDKEGVDREGLTRYDKQYLNLLLHAPNFRAGLNTVVKSIGIDKRTVEQEIEPFLLRKKFIEIGSGGRSLLGKGFDYITEVQDERN